MPKDSEVYFEDIRIAIAKIERYTKGFQYAQFAMDTLVADAVIRNLEIIGEAAKNIPATRRTADVEWKKIAGLRDILIHAYSGVNLAIVWDIVEHKLPELKKAVAKHPHATAKR